MVAKIVAETSTGKERTFTVRSFGNVIKELKLQNGGTVTVMDGIASSWQSTSKATVEGEVKAFETPQTDGEHVGDTHESRFLEVGSKVIFDQKDGQVVNKRGFVKITVEQTEKPWND